ncbi:MAG TPA: ATP-binding protein, partial [Chloroflexota bacterium]|nr:ATP-binding protein [Chloroflexota bacterium]
HPINAEAGTAQFNGQVYTSEGTPVPPDQLPTTEALRGQTVRDRELVIVQPDGHRVPVLANATPIRRPDGPISGAVVTFQDITAIKELERMREEWVSLIAHDLRQPVTVITGYAQRLQRLLITHASPEKEQQTIENVLVSTRSLNRMVGDLLDASRIETRHLTLEKRSVDFAALVRNAVEGARLVARGHSICLEVKGKIPGLDVDSGRIDQVLSNLLSNAAKYAYPDTEIQVEVARVDGEVRVSVMDQGEGIAADELPKLFTRFFRTREVRAKGVAGLGLGLYISKRLIEAHGGQMRAESIPGESTTFRFTLPIPAEDAKPSPDALSNPGP